MELMSPTISEIGKALSKAQNEMCPAKKTKTNPFFKSKYADLEDVIEALRKPFSDNGLSFFQSTLPGEEGGGIIVVTTIAHISGEWVRGYLPIKAAKNDPQGLGSAITYGKRYGLQALSGQPSEDDDGNNASEKTASVKKEKPSSTKSLLFSLDKKMIDSNLTNTEKDLISKFYLEACGLQEHNDASLQDFTEKFDIVFDSYLASIAAV